jgi:UDP-3-O-[3-hydroxymyristoyl] glucosamine N-acyltransferase
LLFLLANGEAFQQLWLRAPMGSHVVAATAVGYDPHAGQTPSWEREMARHLSGKKGCRRVSITVKELAELVQGKVFGDGTTEIHSARALSEAQPGDITFVDGEKHARELHQCRASAVVAPPCVVPNGIPLIQVADPLAAFLIIHCHLHRQVEPPAHGIDARASVHPTVKMGTAPGIFPFAVVGEGVVLGDRCRIHSGAVIGRNCRIGDDVVIHPNAVLYDGTILGSRVIVHAGAVLGADGFGYRMQGGRHVKVPQLGHVEIGDDVEIGAGTTIDRGTFQATRIGEGTKIDNLVQIGHNCQIGRHNLLVSQMGMAGSSSSGDYVVIAGQVGVVGHIHIGDRAMIGGQAGVTKDVPAGQNMLGSPATPEREQKRILMSLERLPEIRKEIRRIKQHIGLADTD